MFRATKLEVYAMDTMYVIQQHLSITIDILKWELVKKIKRFIQFSLLKFFLFFLGVSFLCKKMWHWLKYGNKSICSY